MLRHILLKAIPLASIALTLTGCGGGGGEDEDPPAPATSFTVGGTITGLSGSVVLRLNNGNDLTVNAPGTFAFSPSLPSGTAYAVAVAGQPATQVCGPTVTNGSGTISGANITNVAIVCANFSVGGTVAGLTADGLVLQLVGANDLPVAAASTSFTFPASATLGGGIAYNVSVKSQPAGQTCTIVRARGTVIASAPTATSAAVACVDNVTDPFSGVYRIEGEEGAIRAFVAFNADGTFIFGVHQDDASCGASRGNGIQYGVYNWNQASQRLRIISHAIDTAECGLDIGTDIWLTRDDDGALTATEVDTDTIGLHYSGKLTAVESNVDTLIGGWGTNQFFTVYSPDNTLFSADTRAFVQNTASFPGIEDGCYAVSGTPSAGSYTHNLGSSCTTAIDTSGAGSGLSLFGTQALSFSVTGDSLRFNPSGTTASLAVPRIKASAMPETHSISATINGLTASGLVLQNNGGAGVPVQVGATTAMVATSVAGLKSYFVNVQSQPTGQYCTVANGIGVVTANVASVTINCTTASATTYTVGGTINAHPGTGLALRLNGQAGAAFNVTPAVGATTFSFPAGLQTGTRYVVSIANQPTAPTQLCFTSANPVGVIGTSNIATVAITCVNSSPFKVSGTVSGLTTAGLSLRLTYTDTYTGTQSTPAALGVSANATAFNFSDTIPANGVFDIGIVTQPPGQTCTLTRGRGIGVTNVSNVGIACVNNTTAPLSGTYTALDDEADRNYIAFNADGTYTTALIHHDWQCNAGNDERNGNGVEYGTFSWNQATGTLHFVTPAVIDTNGDCGFNDNPDLNLTRVGNTIELREVAGGPVIFTATAVESTPSSLVGAFVREAKNGSLLVFHADGTFLHVETQLPALFPLGYGQERGCYSISGSTVTLTLDASCRPDGIAAYDLNGSGGFLSFGVTTTAPLPFVINDADTVTLNGVVYKRSKPN